MKLKYWAFTALLSLSSAFGFTSCSNDDAINNTPKGTLPQTRGFVLNEGSMGYNNSIIEVFDFSNDTICSTNLFFDQNGINIGDTGEDLVTDKGNLFLAVNGSGYVAKLNGKGLLLNKFDFTTKPKLGLPENEVISGDYLYVTTTGGYVVKFLTADLSFTDTVKVKTYAQGIAVSNGKIYTANSDMGNGNTMSIIDEGTFTLDETVIVCNDPVKIYSTVGGRIFLLGYDENWNTILYAYDKQTKTVQTIGAASNVIVAGNTLYVANTVTDWTTYENTTMFYTYDVSSGTLNNKSFLKDAPLELSTATVYAMNINPYSGEIYIATTDFKTNGTIYHFAADNTYKSKFTSGGINPNKIVFLK